MGVISPHMYVSCLQDHGLTSARPSLQYHTASQKAHKSATVLADLISDLTLWNYVNVRLSKCVYIMGTPALQLVSGKESKGLFLINQKLRLQVVI